MSNASSFVANGVHAGLGAALQAQGVANNASKTENNLAPYLIYLMFVLVPALIYIVRRRLEGKVAEQMMVPSAISPQSDKEEDVGSEVDARRPLGSVFHDADEAFSSAGHPRLRAERRMFRRVLYVDIGIALGYAVLPAWLGDFRYGEVAGVAVIVALVLAIFSVLRHLLHRSRFQAYDSNDSTMGRWLRWSLHKILMAVSVLATQRVIAPDYSLALLRVVFGPQARMIVSVLLVGGTAIFAVKRLGADQPFHTEALGLLSAACLHVFSFAALAWRLRKVGGLRLLVLRVFKVESASSFMFLGLMRYWHHFGNHFTIVDRELVRQDRSLNWARTTFLAFFLMFVLALVSGVLIESRVRNQLSAVWDPVLATAPALLGAWAALKIGEFRIVRNFVRNHDQILASLRSLEATPRRVDLSFRNLQAMCHKNTWFSAVREFASRADAVLMDLRGFTEERQGCKQEVNFLFDSVPLTRLLFLVDESIDPEVLEGMFQDRWQRLSQESPNLEVSEPVIHLFVVRDSDERDIQAILDRLILIADPPAEA